MNYYNVLIEDLHKSIIILEHKDVYRFVTCCKKYIDFEIHQTDDIENVIVYDMYTQQTRNIPVIEILWHNHHDIHNLEENDIVFLERLNIIRSIIDKYHIENKELSLDQIYDKVVKPNTLNIFDPSSENSVLDFLSYTKFTLSVDDIIADTISEHRKDDVIRCCKFLVQQKLDEILDELNTLKLQTSDPEDISDIDAIESMYKDVLDELDYSSCTTLKDCLKNWPPLLLPMPEYIDMFISKIPKNKKSNDVLSDFMHIVDNSLTQAEIKELLDELETLQPDDADKQNQMDLTVFKKYLLYKLNNEHK
jgi:hypothetical protein